MNNKTFKKYLEDKKINQIKKKHKTINANIIKKCMP